MKSNPTKEKILEDLEKQMALMEKEGLAETGQEMAAYEAHHKLLSQKLDEYAMEIVKECLPIERDTEGWNFYGHPETDFKTGHNFARTQMLEKVKELLNVK